MSQIRSTNKRLAAGKVKSVELVQEAIVRADQHEALGMFVNTTFDRAYELAGSLKTQDFGRSLLAGIPTVLKDNFNWKGTKTTASSNMLKDYESPYSATVTDRLLEGGAPIIGKTNMDAFAHGSSTATSDFGATKNPIDPNYYPGGSSGGSAAAVAAGVVSYAIGSETAGSIKQPAAWCGIVGVAPTYGRLSRYGLIAMGSSLDRPGPMANTVEDCAIVIDVLSGHDPRDATSPELEPTNLAESLSSDIRGLKIGLPKQYWDDRIDQGVREAVKRGVLELEKLGAEIVDIELLDPKISIAVYTIVSRSEISSNLARLDGIRYGHHGDEHAENVLDQIALNRAGGLGNEAKQRSMTGAYTLSAGYYDAYYKKAQQVRNLIKQDLDRALEKVDVIISPTSPTTALKIGDDRVNDPLFGELSDVLVEASALSGMPSISIPAEVGKDNMPVGMQIIGKQWDEQTILNVGHAYEQR